MKVAMPRGLLLCALLAGLLHAGDGRAAELSGQRFADTVPLGGVELQLNGVGLRALFILKAYLVALYVPDRSSDAAELLNQTGPRRLELRMLLDMTPERLIRSFHDGMSFNHTEPQMAELKPQVDALDAALRALGTVRKGDNVDIDLADGSVQLALNGVTRGLPIPGEAIFTAMLRMFVGARPLDKDLKKGLLGG